ncbi:MAG TPA: CHAT domain-containing protein [Thermoanaerobaculia bacterium]|nr:CHAT domain-containing protein [Thermoanaerobaculia bacterium]
MRRFEEMALLIEAAGDAADGSRRCRVRVLGAPFGRGAQHSDFVYSPAELGNLSFEMEAVVRGTGPCAGSLRDIAAVRDAVTPPALRQAGERLYEALFAGPVLNAFLQSSAFVESQPDTGLRIRIEVDPSLPESQEIGSLPWELIYRRETREHLAAGFKTPVVRRLAVPGSTTPAPRLRTLRILAVSARPAGAPRLDLEHEIGDLAAAWRKTPRVEVDVLEHASLSALDAKLRDKPFHVLHFMGHGGFEAATGAGYLLFEDGAGEPVRVDGVTLGEVLRERRALLRLVFLNACDTARLPRHRGQDPFSGVASALVMVGIPSVVAMQFPVSDQAALVFSRRFYQALASGLPVDSAAAAGRRAIQAGFPGSLEWATPALFMSAPDGQIVRPGRRWVRWVVPALLVLGLAAGFAREHLHWAARAGTETERLQAEVARQHVNEDARVCGFVAQTRYAEASNGQPTFLDFGRPYPDEVFSAVIWGGAPERAKYQEPPEVLYVRRNVCVTGRIELFEDKPQIVVRNPAQLTTDDR